MVVHTFLWWVTGHCLRASIIESHNFFVLRRILVKFYIRTWLIGSFPSTYRSWSCAEEKLHFTPVHTLRQLKRDEGLFPPLPISLADRNGLKNLPRQIFMRVFSLVAIRAEMSKQYNQTCPNLSSIQWPCTLSAQCLFCTFECSYSSVLRSILLKLHTFTRLIESFPTVYGLWSCIEIEMSIPLGA